MKLIVFLIFISFLLNCHEYCIFEVWHGGKKMGEVCQECTPKPGYPSEGVFYKVTENKCNEN